MSREERIGWTPEFQIQDIGRCGLKKRCECNDMYLLSELACKKVVGNYFNTQTLGVLGTVHISLLIRFSCWNLDGPPLTQLPIKCTRIIPSGLTLRNNNTFLWVFVYDKDYSLLYPTNMNSAFISCYLCSRNQDYSGQLDRKDPCPQRCVWGLRVERRQYPKRTQSHHYNQ